jgi:hypothetical protein
LIEEWDGKKLDATSANPSSSTCAISFTQTNPHTSGPSAGSTSMPNSSAQPVNHFHSRTTIEGSAPSLGMPQQTNPACLGKSISTPHQDLLYPTLVWNHIPPGIMAGHTLNLIATTQLHTLPQLTPTPSHYLVVCWVSYPSTPTKTCHG